MKKLPSYYPGNDEIVDAYEKADLEKLQGLFNKAAEAWKQEWIAQGQDDEGTCTVGKGLQIWFAAPRKRSAELLTVIPAPPVQGNVSTQKSKHAALAVLEEAGIKAKYYDGWMD